jgi:hypothetical protein
MHPQNPIIAIFSMICALMLMLMLLANSLLAPPLEALSTPSSEIVMNAGGNTIP